MTGGQSSPLTHAQSLIWAGQQLYPDTPLYNMVLAFRIRGPLDPSRFGAAFEALVASTDALRTVVFDVDGTPSQTVVQDLEAELSFTDLTTDQRQETTWRALVQHDAEQPFDLGTRLFRSGLIRLADDDWVWWLSQHHLITDGWAVAIVFERMNELYQMAADGPLPDTAEFPPYSYYVEYEQGFRGSAAHESALEFWREKSAGGVESPTFYGAAGSSGGSTRADRVDVRLGPERSARLEAVLTAGSQGGLMTGMARFNAYATIVGALISRITGRGDVALLTPAHNRPSRRFKSTAGLFIEVLPIHVTLTADETFSTLNAKVGEETRDLLQHGRPATSASALNRSYPVLLNVINAHFGSFNGWPMESAWVHPGHADRDQAFRVQVHDFDGTGDWVVQFELNREIFDHDREHALLHDFEVMFDAYLADPHQEIAGVDLLTDEAQHAIEAFNRTQSARRFEHVPAGFERQRWLTPDAPAVIDGERILTYADLDAASDVLGGRIREAAGGTAGRVAIALPRSADLIIAVLAVWKAGASYVPLDPGLPPDRFAFILEDSQTDVVVRAATPLDVTSQVPEVIAAEATGVAPHTVAPGIDPSDEAYVLYTSGSTGHPKGVRISHAALANYLSWAVDEYTDGPTSFPLYSSFGFDLTVTSLYVPLLTGGAVVVYRAAEEADLAVIDVFERDEVDVVKLTPAHLALLDDDLLSTARIRRLIVGGEELRSVVAQRAVEASNGALTIFNEYGPTEATVGCMLHRYEPDIDTAASVPLGRPAANTAIRILDDLMRPVPIGVAGEICISGDGVADGYVGLPDLNRDRFVPDPHEPGRRMYRSGDLARWRRPGVMEFLGRFDDQVKIRGYRVELGEIEAAVLAHPDVAGAVADVTDAVAHSSEHRQLVVYYTASNPEVDDLRGHLERSLPDYMLPTHLVEIPDIPLTVNGKVDRRALPDPREVGRRQGRSPATDMERRLAEIWSAVLGVDSVAVDRPFIELGGDSILSIQIVARARKLGIRFTPNDLLRNSTVADLARVAELARAEEVRDDATGVIRPTPIQHWLRSLGPERFDEWSQAVVLAWPGGVSEHHLRTALRALIRHHPILGARVVSGDDWWLEVPMDVTGPVIETLDTSAVDAPGLERLIAATANRLNRSLDLASGRNVAVARFEGAPEDADHTLILIHHLVVDGVSWMALLEDLESAYRAAERGETPVLGSPTSSFRAWSERLNDSDLRFPGRARPQFGDSPDQKLGTSAPQTVTAVLTPPNAGRVLRILPSGYNMGVDEVLIAALAKAYFDTTGDETLEMHLESHGRVDLDDLDLTRTVGWFTSLFPVTLNAPADADTLTVTRVVKEALHSVPDLGFGYGVERYLRGGDRQPWDSAVEPAILFNHLGRFGRSGGGIERFSLVGPLRLVKDADLSLPHALEVNSHVEGESVTIEWSFNPGAQVGEHLTLSEESVVGLMERLEAALVAMADALGTSELAGYTPSDFPHAGLSQDDLDDLLATFGGQA